MATALERRIGLIDGFLKLFKGREPTLPQVLPSAEAVIEPEIPQEIRKGLAQEWSEETGNPNPISWRSRIGAVLPLKDGQILLNSGKIIRVHDDSKVSLMSKDGERPLGVTVYQLTQEHLK